MKNAIFLTLAAAVATIPAILGVTGNTTFSQSIPASIPSGASVVPSVDDHPHATATSTSATPSAESGDDRGRGSDDQATSASPTADDRRGRGSDDGATAAASRSTAIAQTTVDDHGVGTEAGDDSGGHGGRSGNSGQARDD